MSTDTMSTNGFILLNSKGREIEDLFDIEIENQPYDYSSPIERPDFFTPAPVSPKKFVFGPNFPGPFKMRRETNWRCVSILGKRKHNDAFEDESDDERYGQHIGQDFFAINVGHGVLPKDDSWDEYIRQEGRRERDSESKYDPEEVLNWCYQYLAEKKNI